MTALPTDASGSTYIPPIVRPVGKSLNNLCFGTKNKKNTNPSLPNIYFLSIGCMLIDFT